MAQRSYRWVLWLLAFLGVMADQASKYGVFHWLYPPHEQRYEIVPGVFRLLAQDSGMREEGTGFLASLRTISGDILPQVNKGALFGLGNDYANLANTLFAVVSLVAAVAILMWSRRDATARDLPLCAALGLILAGTLGNLYDRVVFHGVRDFLYFYWINWPVFNVADSCLVCGAGMLLFQAFWTQSVAVPRSQSVASANQT